MKSLAHKVRMYKNAERDLKRAQIRNWNRLAAFVGQEIQWRIGLHQQEGKITHILGGYWSSAKFRVINFKTGKTSDISCASVDWEVVAMMQEVRSD